MINIEIKGKDYSLRNEGSEVTLNELAEISHILDVKDGSDDVTKWLKVLCIIGSKQLAEVVPLKRFAEIVNLVQITNIENEIQKTIEVNGRTYSVELENGELDLSAMDLSKIISMVNKGGVWGNKAFAVVYKDDQLTNTEHYTDAHIEHKAKLFGEQVTADIAAPVIFQLAKEVVLNVESMVKASKEDQGETVEQEIESTVDQG